MPRRKDTRTRSHFACPCPTLHVGGSLGAFQGLRACPREQCGVSLARRDASIATAEVLDVSSSIFELGGRYEDTSCGSNHPLVHNGIRDGASGVGRQYGTASMGNAIRITGGSTHLCTGFNAAILTAVDRPPDWSCLRADGANLRPAGAHRACSRGYEQTSRRQSGRPRL